MVERLTKAVDYVRLMDISDFEENEKVKFYTRLSSTQVLQATFNLILSGINQQKNFALTAFQIYHHINENEIEFASTGLSLPV